MTGPIVPSAPGAPAGQQVGQPGTTDTGTEPGAPAAGTGVPAGVQPGGQAPADGDIKSLPEWAQSAIEKLRGESAKSRTTAKANAADEARQQLAQDIGKVLGLVKDEKDQLDPAKLSEQVGNLSGDLRTKTIELAAWQACSRHGADPQALLDSRAFATAAAALDPTAADFATQLDGVITKAVAANPRLKALQPSSRSGGDFTGGPGNTASLDDQIEEATKARDFKRVIALKRQRSTQRS